MTDWATAEADYLAELGRRPGARAPATFGEIWNSEFQRSRLDTPTGLSTLTGEAYNELLEKTEGAIGRPPHEALRDRGVQLGTIVTMDARARAVASLFDLVDDDKRKELAPLADIRLRASERAQKLEREAAEVGAVTYGLSGVATSFAAGVARQALEPVNLATMPLGGPLRGPLLPMLLREAGIGAGIQAAQEPFVQSQRAELGLEAGVAQGAMNIGQAALGQAGLAGLFRAGAAGIRLLRQGTNFSERSADLAIADEVRPNDGVTLPTENILPSGANSPDASIDAALRTIREILSPEDLEAAARVAERDQVIAGAAGDGVPPPAPGFVRFYHGGFDPTSGGARWVTPDPVYARDFRAGDTPNEVHYVDIPKGDAAEIAARAWDEIDERGGTNAVGQYRNTELPEAWAKQLKPFDTAAARVDHVKAVDDAAAAIEAGRPVPGAPAAAAPEPDVVDVVAPGQGKKWGRALLHPREWTMFEYLASRGGIQPTPDVRYVLDKGSRLVPGFGALVRKKGMSIDDAITALREGGYIPEARANEEDLFGPADFYEMLAEEARGNKQHVIGFVPEAKIDPAEQRVRIESAFDARMAELEITGIKPRDRAAALRMIERSGISDPLVAYEHVLLQHELRDEAKRAKLAKDYDVDIPFDDIERSAADAARQRIETEPDDAGTASRLGEQAADGTRERPGERAPGEPAREAGGGDREAGQPEQLGDPALALEAERVLADHGGDLQITIQLPDGTLRTASARELLREADDDARAAAELIDCIGKPPEVEP